jgi:hypothetical protein
MPCHVIPCHAMPCHAMPCHAMPCQVMSCHVMSCQVRSGQGQVNHHGRKVERKKCSSQPHRRTGITHLSELRTDYCRTIQTTSIPTCTASSAQPRHLVSAPVGQHGHELQVFRQTKNTVEFFSRQIRISVDTVRLTDARTLGTTHARPPGSTDST